MDDEVRWHVYDVTMSEGEPPTKARLAALLGEDVTASLQRLAAARMLVLQPETGEVLMAGPFSAVPTPFRVTLPAFSCYGNCMWDALGIAATMQSDARIDTSCADCGAAAELRVENGAVLGDGFMHFPLPPKLWWQDVVFT
jgi:hypothetical protein